VNSAMGLCFQRLFLGIAGSSFVMGQYWPTCMFVDETAGVSSLPGTVALKSLILNPSLLRVLF
jgi:hypothetical protein